MAEALLSLQQIVVRYAAELTVLQFSALEVHDGEVLAIIGPNGAGKSTLLRVMGLLQQPTEGKVFFRGSEVTSKHALSIRRRMASVFQEPLLLSATVYDNAALGLKLRGLNRRAIAQKIHPWLERLSIAHLAQRQARSLSGGEAQRTSLARAFAVDPELLLFDEPFSSLDPPTREGLLLDLAPILRESTVATVFVTHDRDEAITLGDRIGVLLDGKLLQLGVAAEVFAHPINAEVAHFVGIDTQIPGVVESASEGLVQVRINGGCAQVVGNFQAGEQLFLCLRPEDITVSLPGAENPKSSGRNRLPCTAVKIVPWGSRYRLALACGENRLVAFMTKTSFLELRIAEGDEVVAWFEASAVHVIKQS